MNIDIQNLCVELGGRAILSEVALRIEQGQHVAVIGPNGAGKSTLLRCVAGLLRPAAGTILLGSDDVAALSPREMARRVAFVMQQHEAPPFSVFDFVLMARYAHVNPWAGYLKDDEAKATAALARLGIADFAERRMDTLSGGELQKVYLAAALAQHAPILIMDEPATYLDYAHQLEIATLIGELRSGPDYTLLTVTHDLNQCVLDADAVLALKDGRAAFLGAPDELLKGDVLQDIMVCALMSLIEVMQGALSSLRQSAHNEAAYLASRDFALCSAAGVAGCALCGHAFHHAGRSAWRRR